MRAYLVKARGAKMRAKIDEKCLILRQEVRADDDSKATGPHPRPRAPLKGRESVAEQAVQNRGKPSGRKEVTFLPFQGGSGGDGVQRLSKPVHIATSGSHRAGRKNARRIPFIA